MPATVQGLNLINVLANGTINSTELETALTTDSLDGSFEGALSSAPIQNWLGNSTNAPDIIANSATALAAVMSITGAAASLLKNNDFADLALANSTYRDTIFGNTTMFTSMIASEGGAQALADNSTACLAAMQNGLAFKNMFSVSTETGRSILEEKIRANSTTMSALDTAATTTYTDTRAASTNHIEEYLYDGFFATTVDTGYNGTLGERRIQYSRFLNDSVDFSGSYGGRITVANATAQPVDGTTFSEATGRFYWTLSSSYRLNLYPATSGGPTTDVTTTFRGFEGTLDL